MSTVQINLAQAFNLRVAVGNQVVTFPLRRGFNWIDESVKDTPEYQLMVSRLELPIEAVQAQLIDPVKGINGGVPVRADTAVAEAKANAERAVAENKEYERRKKEEEAAAKDGVKTLDETAAEQGPKKVAAKGRK